jgi:5S rRNA maturation endonuclease (ribonuclease M5)
MRLEDRNKKEEPRLKKLLAEFKKEKESLIEERRISEEETKKEDLEEIKEDVSLQEENKKEERIIDLSSYSYLRKKDPKEFIDAFLEFYKNKGLTIKPWSKGWRILCPFHNDTEPSLGIYKDGGCYCFSWKCKKTYKLADVYKAYGFWEGEVKDPELKPSFKEEKENWRIVDLKQYLYSDGERTFVRIRIDYENVQTKERNKVFYFYQPVFKNGKEQLELVKGDIPLILYYLLNLEDKDKVFFVEGEKCADALWELELPATTLPIGASSKINKKIIQALMPLQKKEVFIIPDNDEAGRMYAKNIERALRTIEAKARIIEIPVKLWEKADIADYIEILKSKGLTKNEIREKILSLIEEYKGTVPFEKVLPRAIDWSIPDWIIKGQLNLIAGAPDVGKTRLAIVLTSIKANGSKVWTAEGFKEVFPEKVIFYTVEDIKENLAYWCDKVGVNRTNIEINDMPSFFDILQEIEEKKPALVVIDPANYLVKGDLNQAKDIQEFLKPFLNLAKKHNIAILLVWHLNKREAKDPLKLVLGSGIIPAIVKRILFLEKQDNKTIVHFRKTANTSPVAFIANENTFEWVKEKIEEEFGNHIPKGKEIADLILNALNDAKEKGLSYNQILKIVEPYGITKENLRQILHRYLKDKTRKESIKDKNGTFKEWKYFLSSVTNFKCHTGENVEKSSTLSSVTVSSKKELEDASPLQKFENSKIGDDKLLKTPFNKKVSHWIKHRNNADFIQSDSNKSVTLVKSEENQGISSQPFIFKAYKEDDTQIACICGCGDFVSKENPLNLIKKNKAILTCCNCNKEIEEVIKRVQIIYPNEENEDVPF